MIHAVVTVPGALSAAGPEAGLGMGLEAGPETGEHATMRGPEPALALALADELVRLTSVLGELAYDLASNSETLRQHMHSLQSIDHITQAQLAIADLLRAPTRTEEALKAVTLDDLGASIGRAVARYRLHDSARD